VLVSGLVAGSRAGYALRAIHQDEQAAAAMGVNTTRIKVLTFALSGLITGLVGATYAFQQVTIFPERLFDVDITVLMVVMVVIGGSGTVLGPLVGAVILQFLSEYLRQNYTSYHIFLLGAIIIVAVVLLPQGAVNYLRDARRTGEYSLLANVRRYRL
jgi:branched-chain amino acid transport system permease protein